MTQPTPYPPLSPALGLWTRHSVIMDELWSMEGLTESDADAGTPQSIRNFLDDHGEVLDRVFRSAELDSRRLLDHLRDRLVSHVEAGDRRLIVEPAKNVDWACRIKVAKQTRSDEQLTLELHLASTTKSPEQALCLLAVPFKGTVQTRKRTLAWLQSEFDTDGCTALKLSPSFDLSEHTEFGRAHIVLHRIPLKTYLEDFNLKMHQLADAFLSDLEWFTADRLRKLMHVCEFR